MTTPSSQVVAIPPDQGYAPGFAVAVEGEPVNVHVQDDVLEIHVVLELDQMASFEITFNNWTSCSRSAGSWRSSWGMQASSSRWCPGRSPR
jgi:hypothetical protein